MNLSTLVSWAQDKTRFGELEGFSTFCRAYLEYIQTGLQAVIVSQKENNYCFFQYNKEGQFQVSRPINSELFVSIDHFDAEQARFLYALQHIAEIRDEPETRNTINRFVYTCQQAIGAALDALPASQSNTARKLAGDLFEDFIRIIFVQLGVEVTSGDVNVPIVVDDVPLFRMKYQHDLIVKQGDCVKAIGSVKTSSKDRIDKVFIDKYLYNRLTGEDTPHFAVFLNDVQRKGIHPRFSVQTTFLIGHFKGYTVKLCPLDGVYYCDLRPIMRTDELLRQSIRTLDCLFVEDLWNFLT